MRLVRFERARTIDAPAPWVQFALRNTDITTRMNGAVFKVTGATDRGYDGTFFGLRVDVEILGERAPMRKGEVDAVATVKFPLLLGSTHTVAHHKYCEIDSGTTLVELQFSLDTRGVLMGIYALFLRARIGKYLDQLMGHIQNSAVALHRNAPALSKLLTEQQLLRASDFRVELATTQRYIERQGDIDQEKEKRPWDAELHELSSLYAGFKEQAGALKEELQRIREARDAVATLLIARRVLEVIVSKLCEHALNRPRGTEPLAAVIDKLDRTDQLPDYVCTSMRNLNGLSTYGAHPKKFSTRQVREALIGLCSIMEWYATHVPGESSADDSAGACVTESVSCRNQAEYKAALSAVYADGIVNETQRSYLGELAQKLGIKKGAAQRIEDSYASDSSRNGRGQASLGLSASDGKTSPE